MSDEGPSKAQIERKQKKGEGWNPRYGKNTIKKKDIWNKTVKDANAYGKSFMKGTDNYKELMKKYKVNLEANDLKYTKHVHQTWESTQKYNALREAQVSMLRKIYYGKDLSSWQTGGGMFVGPRKLYELLKVKETDLKKRPTRRQTEAWLNNQLSYQLVKQHRKPQSISTVISRPFYLLQADLTDLIGGKGGEEDFVNVKARQTKDPLRSIIIDSKKLYILVVVENYTKYAWVRAMPNKDAKTTAKYMKQILDEIKSLIESSALLKARANPGPVEQGSAREVANYVSKFDAIPHALSIDNGAEFKGEFINVIENFWPVRANGLTGKGISLERRLGIPGKPAGQGGVERLNKTIKRAMKQWLISTKKQDWSKALDNLVNGENGYNNQYHRSVEMTPKVALEAVKTNNTAKLKAINSALSKRTIENNKWQRRTANWKDVKVGDIVRVRLYALGVSKLILSWSRQVYEVTELKKAKPQGGGKSKSKPADPTKLAYGPRVDTYRVKPVDWKPEAGYAVTDGVANDKGKWEDADQTLNTQVWKKNLVRAEVQRIDKDKPPDETPYKEPVEDPATRRARVAANRVAAQGQQRARVAAAGLRKSKPGENRYPSGMKVWVKQLFEGFTETRWLATVQPDGEKETGLRVKFADGAQMLVEWDDLIRTPANAGNSTKLP